MTKAMGSVTWSEWPELWGQSLGVTVARAVGSGCGVSCEDQAQSLCCCFEPGQVLSLYIASVPSTV